MKKFLLLTAMLAVYSANVKAQITVMDVLSVHDLVIDSVTVLGVTGKKVTVNDSAFYFTSRNNVYVGVSMVDDRHFGATTQTFVIHGKTTWSMLQSATIVMAYVTDAGDFLGSLKHITYPTAVDVYVHEDKPVADTVKLTSLKKLSSYLQGSVKSVQLYGNQGISHLEGYTGINPVLQFTDSTLTYSATWKMQKEKGIHTLTSVFGNEGSDFYLYLHRGDKLLVLQLPGKVRVIVDGTKGEMNFPVDYNIYL